MKLLVVDDEPLARDRLKRLLAVRGDCTAVAEAANGIEAIAANATQEPDVILLDARGPSRRLERFPGARRLGGDVVHRQANRTQ